MLCKYNIGCINIGNYNFSAACFYSKNELSFFSLSENKGLCGVPSLPECPFLWNNGRLSNGGKIAIGVSCMVVVIVLVLVTYICIRRKRNDYDFGLPQELMCKFTFTSCISSHLHALRSNIQVVSCTCSIMFCWKNIGYEHCSYSLSPFLPVITVISTEFLPILVLPDIKK